MANHVWQQADGQGAHVEKLHDSRDRRWCSAEETFRVAGRASRRREGGAGCDAACPSRRTLCFSKTSSDGASTDWRGAHDLGV